MTSALTLGRYTGRCDHAALRRLLSASDEPFCPECGVDLAEQTTPVLQIIRPEKPRRVRPPPTTLDERDIRRYVFEALDLNRQEHKAERAARMTVSTVAPALSAIELGITGNGCTGTKRGWRPVDGRDCDHMEVRELNPEYGGRYAQLSHEARVVTDAIIDDGGGFQDLARQFGTRTHVLTIYQRIALRLATRVQADKWHGKFASGDCGPALAASEREGQALLRTGARAWWGA
jgi:hypothetical protein